MTANGGGPAPPFRTKWLGFVAAKKPAETPGESVRPRAATIHRKPPGLTARRRRPRCPRLLSGTLSEGAGAGRGDRAKLRAVLLSRRRRPCATGKPHRLLSGFRARLPRSAGYPAPSRTWTRSGLPVPSARAGRGPGRASPGSTHETGRPGGRPLTHPAAPCRPRQPRTPGKGSGLAAARRRGSPAVLLVLSNNFYPYPH